MADSSADLVDFGGKCNWLHWRQSPLPFPLWWHRQYRIWERWKTLHWELVSLVILFLWAKLSHWHEWLLGSQRKFLKGTEQRENTDRHGKWCFHFEKTSTNYLLQLKKKAPCATFGKRYIVKKVTLTFYSSKATK